MLIMTSVSLPPTVPSNQENVSRCGKTLVDKNTSKSFEPLQIRDVIVRLRMTKWCRMRDSNPRPPHYE